jgi:hypothetical protein
MPCEERDKLLELFLEAAKAHSDAVHACLGRQGEALERLTALAESAEKPTKTATLHWPRMSVPTDARLI